MTLQVFANPFASAPLVPQPPDYGSVEMRQVNDSLAYGSGGEYGTLGAAAAGDAGVAGKEDSLAWLFRDWMAPGFTTSTFATDDRSGTGF